MRLSKLRLGTCNEVDLIFRFHEVDLKLNNCMQTNSLQMTQLKLSYNFFYSNREGAQIFLYGVLWEFHCHTSLPDKKWTVFSTVIGTVVAH